MADTDRIDVDGIRKDLEKQIADLRNEVGRLSASLAERGETLYEGAKEEAGEFYAGAARQVRNQAHAVSEAIRENPGTAATVLSSAGLLGFLIGLVVGQALSDNNHSRRWY